MQLLAIAENGRLTPADRAQKGVEYRCLECGSGVRIRKGREVRAHFYHPRHSSHCHQSSKSLAHLQTQLYLQKQLPENEITLELPFPNIHRIADVAWTSQKILFEIQCSPISFDEIVSRNRDYASEGYRVIWVFHERTFNKNRIKGAEILVWNHPHYFTNINAQGVGEIYDQYAIEKKGRRIFRFPRFPIKPSRLEPISTKPTFTQRTQRRLEAWPYAFQGEMAHCEASGEKEEQVNLVRAKEAALSKKKQPATFGDRLRGYKNATLFWYRVFFHLLLERVCH